jgi:hypothetical protein
MGVIRYPTTPPIDDKFVHLRSIFLSIEEYGVAYSSLFIFGKFIATAGFQKRTGWLN